MAFGTTPPSTKPPADDPPQSKAPRAEFSPNGAQYHSPGRRPGLWYCAPLGLREFCRYAVRNNSKSRLKVTCMAPAGVDLNGR